MRTEITPRSRRDHAEIMPRYPTQEVFEELRVHTYDKFAASSYYAGVHDLKMREKEFPTVHHFYYIKKLGTGSFGEVFAVRKKDSHKRCAPAYRRRASHRPPAVRARRARSLQVRDEGDEQGGAGADESALGDVRAHRGERDGIAQPPVPRQPQLLLPDAADGETRVAAAANAAGALL